ncbi:MAG: bifunctional aldolase/short-chain dehydrogenase [Zetaproteobacteria bacterium]|nr:MAG: bifunctional aldolase/short-chain dehydrogenase [Zetaproteobacteria bacterium]
MINRWDAARAAALADDPLALRVYSSRLLGAEPSLVLHGGGNTSVKTTEHDLFGDPVETLWVKGSGWDLATIEKAGFAPVRLKTLQRMAELPELSDRAMVRHQRAAMLDPTAPNPSVEAILHAIIPYRFVDHTHADAVVTICHTPDGEAALRELYGGRMLLLPYVMPGFDLARQVFAVSRELDWGGIEGIILFQHGIFTFADDAEASYRRMIDAVSTAEQWLGARTTARAIATQPTGRPDPLALAAIRKQVADLRGTGTIALCNTTTRPFADRPDVAQITARGPLTPDHIIRTKRTPVVLQGDAAAAITAYAEDYRDYFARHHRGETMLNPAPCWAVWPGVGTIAFGGSPQEATIVDDIVRHTVVAIDRAEQLGGWQALGEAELFAVEYWELEQAKLARGGNKPELAGRIALVTGAASGIGKATVEALRASGAAVAALDVDRAGLDALGGDPGVEAICCDMTDRRQVVEAVERSVRRFGGLDIVVSNAGVFPPSSPIEAMDAAAWQQSLTLNLTSHQWLLTAAAPFLKLGVAPAVIINGSKNVPAPGPGAAAYSVAKAGLTQLARVAALELGAAGIRVNTVHPNGVFDTALWSEALLADRAARYGLTVEQYKRNNLLRCEVTSRDVARMITAMAGDTFRATTGAQVPVDGGNERVI